MGAFKFAAIVFRQLNSSAIGCSRGNHVCVCFCFLHLEYIDMYLLETSLFKDPNVTQLSPFSTPFVCAVITEVIIA